MRPLLFVFLLLFPQIGFSKLIRYEISPLFQGDALRLQVRVWFAGDADGTTELLMPNPFAGAENLFRCIQNLSCTTSGVILQINPDSLFATLEHAPNQELKLYYEVVQDFAGAPTTKRTAFRPILQANYFHVLGNALFIAPKWNEAYEVALEWRNFPDNWLLHNSFGSRSASQRFTFKNLSWLQSVFVGGDYRVLETEVEGRPVWLVIRGENWSFSDDTLRSMLQRTVMLQRDFWQDFDVPCYTVALTPFALRSSLGEVFYLGTGLTNSFTAFITPSGEKDLRDLHCLFHHEMMHHWIGSKIRSGTRAADMQFAWLIEGFSEYFALKNMLAGDFIDADQFMQMLNGRFFDGLHRSPKREAPNSAIADSFFVNASIERLPYLRGCVFAFFLDNAMKSGGNDQKNLHQFMLDLLEYYYQRPDRDLLNNFDFFLETCSEYLQTDAEPLYQEHILKGKLIPADAFALPPYFKMEVDEEGQPFFWLDKSVAGWEKRLKE